MISISKNFNANTISTIVVLSDGDKYTALPFSDGAHWQELYNFIEKGLKELQNEEVDKQNHWAYN